MRRQIKVQKLYFLAMYTVLPLNDLHVVSEM